MAQRAIKSGRRGWVKSAVKLTNKTVLITGANTGIGLETAVDLAKREARVIIACRSQEKGKAALDKVKRLTGSTNVALKSLDLTSLQSVRDLAQDIKDNEKQLDILINNAGVMKVPEGKTKDGFETHFGVNHLGHFLLTNLLLQKIKENPSGRIITLTSIAHKLGRIHWDDLNFRKKYVGFDAYAQSKLMNAIFSVELSRRLADTGITSNSVHPGVVLTELNRYPGKDRSVLARVTDILFTLKWFLKTPRQGAQTSIYCAIAPELENVSGKHFADCAKRWQSFAARSEAKGKRLWEISEEYTGLK